VEEWKSGHQRPGDYALEGSEWMEAKCKIIIVVWKGRDRECITK
jgi:hypothetical protein